MHAFYKQAGINYRHRRRNADGGLEIARTKSEAERYWELSQCLKPRRCPLDDGTKRNLEYLVEIRHEIEHRMTTRIDDTLSSKLQACCLNFNRVLKEQFGTDLGLDGELSFALQFVSISPEHQKALLAETELPAGRRAC